MIYTISILKQRTHICEPYRYHNLFIHVHIGHIQCIYSILDRYS